MRDVDTALYIKNAGTTYSEPWVSNRSLYQIKALKSLSEHFKSLSGLATHDRGRKQLREAVMWLKSNSVTDHHRVYNKNLSVSQDKLLDGGSNPPRSTNGTENLGAKMVYTPYLLRYIWAISLKLARVDGRSTTGLDWIRQQWKVRH